MKRNLLCFAAVFAVALTLPTAVFASTDHQPVSHYTSAVSSSSDDWLPVTEEILAEQAAIIDAAATDPSIVIDDEMNNTDIETDTDNEILSDGDSGVSTRSIDSSYIGATRYSGTSGKVSASAGFTKKASKATCSISLQEKYNGSWRAATGLPVRAYVKTVYDTYSISLAKTFTLKSGKVYRAKIIFTDTNSSGTYHKTRYTGSF